MSREAKYRCWHKQAKEYRVIESVDFDKDGKAECIVTLDYNTWHDPWNDLVEDVELEQYTGLKDKNGKEICEGDIVLDYYDGDDAFIVEWDKDKASFILTGTDNIASVSFDNFYSDKDLEIIGNIHENPELLGGEL